MVERTKRAHLPVTEQCCVSYITTEVTNVLGNPVQSHYLVSEPEISGREAVVERQPAEDVRPVLDGDDHDAFSGDVKPGNAIRRPVVGFLAADDDEDWESTDLHGRFRRPDVQVQAVLGRLPVTAVRRILEILQLRADRLIISGVVRPVPRPWWLWWHESVGSQRWFSIRHAEISVDGDARCFGENFKTNQSALRQSHVDILTVA